MDIASGMDVYEAYMKHYSWKGSPINGRKEASDTVKRIEWRIEELRAQYANVVIKHSRGEPSKKAAEAYGVAEAMEELNRAMAHADEKANAQAMAKIVEVKMKLYGLGIADAKNPADNEMPPEEIEDALRRLKEWRVANGR